MENTMTATMSGTDKKTKYVYDYLPDLEAIREEQAWDDYLAWCRENENTTHE